MRRPAAGVFLLAATTLSSGHSRGECRAPRITIEGSSTPRQGGIVAVTLRSDVPLLRATLSDGRHEALMEPDSNANGRIFRALWGFDFESAAGARRVRVEAVGLCGDAHQESWNPKVNPGRFPEQKLTVDPAYVEPPPSELER